MDAVPVFSTNVFNILFVQLSDVSYLATAFFRPTSPPWWMRCSMRC